MRKRAVLGKRSRVLFVTWDGPEYHYLESLFLPIFAGLKDHGFDFDVLQFTWGGAERRAETAAAAARLGIGYRWVEVIRKPVAAGSLLTAILAGRTIRRAARDHASDIVLARSTLPALATMLARGAGATWRFVLDLDGFPTEERVEFAGLDPRSAIARLLWGIERRAIRDADAITVRSSAVIRLIQNRDGVTIPTDKFFRIPNCRDERQFRPADLAGRLAARRRLGLPDDARVIAYVGSSLSGKYRGDSLLDLFGAVRRSLSSARLLILTSEPAKARDLLMTRASQLAPYVVIDQAPATEVPFLLGAADLGTAFIEPSPSMQAAAAVKLGEYLLCGLPVVATKGIGDVHERLGGPAVLFLDDNGTTEIARAAAWFCSWVDEEAGPDRRGEARAAGLAEYGLEAGALDYVRALRHALAQ